MYCTWSLGSVVAPFIIQPFLAETDDGIATNMTNYSVGYFQQLYSQQSLSPKDNFFSQFTYNSMSQSDSRIEIAYIIIACSILSVAVASFLFYMLGSKDERISPNAEHKALKDIFSLPKAAEAPAKFAIPMCLLFIMYYFFVAGAELTLYTWLYTYALESDLPFTNQEAATLDAAGKASYLVGRVLDIVLAKLIPIQCLLLASVALSTVSAITLVTVGPLSKGALYACVCSFQFLFAPMWPGGVSWLDKYLKVVAVVYMFSNLGASIAAMYFQWFSGFLFANGVPESVLVLVMGCTILLGVTLSVMQIMGNYHGNRYKYQHTTHTKSISNTIDSEVFQEDTTGNINITVQSTVESVVTDVNDNGRKPISKSKETVTTKL